MSRLATRVAALERTTARRQGQSRCATCREWPSKHVLLTEIDADGIVARQDRLDGPTTCPGCGWAATVYDVEVVEVKDWDRVGRHGLD